MLNKKTCISAAIIIILTLLFLAYFLVFTTSGSTFLLSFTLARYIPFRDINITEVNGSLAKGLSLQDVEIKDIKELPKSSNIKIQKLNIRLSYFSAKGLNIELFNGRLNLAENQQLLFQGTYKQDSLDLNAYATNLDVNLISGLKDLSGNITDVDIYIKGSLSKPQASGEFRIERLLYKGFFAIDCPAAFDIILEDIQKTPRLFGEVIVKTGTISGARTAIIHLENSKISFAGNHAEPKLNLAGNSSVGAYKINIKLKGAVDEPELNLTSEPPASQARLLIMLATGKSWSGADEALSKGMISADLTKDFVDYFFFGGAGGKLAEHFGIDISVQYNAQTKGIGIKKSITPKAQVSYSTEQTLKDAQDPAVKQKIGTEYKITEIISIGAEKEIKGKTGQTSEVSESQDKPQTDDRVILKYKKEF